MLSRESATKQFYIILAIVPPRDTTRQSFCRTCYMQNTIKTSATDAKPPDDTIRRHCRFIVWRHDNVEQQNKNAVFLNFTSCVQV